MGSLRGIVAVVVAKETLGLLSSWSSCSTDLIFGVRGVTGVIGVIGVFGVVWRLWPSRPEPWSAERNGDFSFLVSGSCSSGSGGWRPSWEMTTLRLGTRLVLVA